MLGFPNREVKKALFELVLPIMLKKIDCSYAVQYTEKRTIRFLMADFELNFELIVFFVETLAIRYFFLYHCHINR